MTQEDKDLLLKDLCARLPYEVKVKITSRDSKNRIVYLTEDNICHLTIGWWSECKPYLFPLSSMTPKQKSELSMLIADSEGMFDSVLIEIDFYHKYHIDYRGLIEKGLANDATGLNIY